MHQWIETFLCQRKQRVIVLGILSSEVVVDSGVPQRTILAPILFLSYINNLPEYVDYPNVDLSTLEILEDTWKMDFNPSKCFSMNIITKKRNPVITDYSIKGTILVNTDNSTYLGVTTRKDLKWGNHVNKIISKANKTLGLLRRNIKTDNTTQKLRPEPSTH